MTSSEKIPAEEFPTLEESLTYIRGNYNELFPTVDGRRKTIGNIPTSVHAKLSDMAARRNLRMFEIIAGMVDFYTEYEAVFEAELAEKRGATKTRR